MLLSERLEEILYKIKVLEGIDIDDITNEMSSIEGSINKIESVLDNIDVDNLTC